MRYADVNLNKDPCLVPSCGHLITMASLDDYLGFKNKCERNGFMTDLRRTSIPFSSVGIKGCPTCQMPLQPLNRYSRVFKRNILDKAAKELIARTHTEFVPLTQRLQDRSSTFWTIRLSPEIRCIVCIRKPSFRSYTSINRGFSPEVGAKR